MQDVVQECFQLLWLDSLFVSNIIQYDPVTSTATQLSLMVLLTLGSDVMPVYGLAQNEQTMAFPDFT